jgi:hypothetical protein
MPYDELSEIGLRKVLRWPHVDLDITITWTVDKPTTIEVVGLGKTKTMTLTWSGDNLTSIATVIT